MRIAADGTWYYRGTPIRRQSLVKLFSTVLRREDGAYWLVTPVERGRIVVEDAPFLAVELEARGAGRSQELWFRTNVDDWILAGKDHPIRVSVEPDSGEPRPYILVRDGLDALISRSVFYELAERVVEHRENGGGTLGVWSDRTYFPLGSPATD